ncbi:fimbrillin family protein [uncultured Bacteroides sp.]|uniref:fimbrillin family protein n=1 Tax=uncultured Bacteroides sp. TaxID=162156 RepID=UPI00262359BD|nr:fimbrillin family protein [uncultured Bacteroides sp.]
MRQCYFYGMLVAAAMMTTSCGSDSANESENTLPSQGESSVYFEATINPLSRATDTQFDSGDAIGVFGVLSTGNDNKGIIAASGNYADNVRYAYDGNKFTSAAAIEKPENGDKVYYHAVYPYTSNAKNQYEFTIASDQRGSGYTNSDLCTANTTATDETLVSLKFNHRLSKMIINLQGDNWPSGDMGLSLVNVYTTAKVDLNSLSFTATGNRGDVICSDNGTRSFKAILPPQLFEDGTEIAILTIGNEQYTVTMNGSMEIKSGLQTELTIAMTENKEIVEFIGDINPWGEADDRLDEVVPEEIQDALEPYMPIYNGINPPIVEGQYLISQMVTVYCEDQGVGGYDPGDVVKDTYIRFYNQNTTNNTLDYEDKSGNSASVGKGAFISGYGDYFSAFFNTEGVSDGIKYKTALIISGIKTSSGIRDLYYAFIMVEKGADPEEELMDEGVFRVFKDGDGLAANTAWTRNNVTPDFEQGFSAFSKYKK